MDAPALGELQIIGVNFPDDGSLQVELGGLGTLPILQQNGTTEIIVELPQNVPPGDYLLSVYNESDDGPLCEQDKNLICDTHDLTIGGADGIHCWDLNGNRVNEVSEDFNGDGEFNADDCIGPEGPKGDTGAAGADGANGADGMRGANCWETFIENNGSLSISVPHPLTGAFINIPPGGRFVGLDYNEDGSFDFQDCKGVDGTDGSDILDQDKLDLIEAVICSAMSRSTDDDPSNNTLFYLLPQTNYIKNLCRRGVFVTNGLHDGDFGGVFRANDICQAEADAAGLDGVWQAWISSDGFSGPQVRMPMPGAPYNLMNTSGVPNSDMIMDSYRHRIEREDIRNPINTTATGVTLTGEERVWTGTNPNGHDNAPNCNNWKSNSSSDSGRAGNMNKTGKGWSNDGTPNCSNALRLYCFQQ